MASYGSREVETTAIVKGGLPVAVAGTYSWDEAGADVTDIVVRWSNTGKRVTKAFEASLSRADWDSIVDAIAED
jgi:hypothetical protein